MQVVSLVILVAAKMAMIIHISSQAEADQMFPLWNILVMTHLLVQATLSKSSTGVNSMLLRIQLQQMKLAPLLKATHINGVFLLRSRHAGVMINLILMEMIKMKFYCPFKIIEILLRIRHIHGTQQIPNMTLCTQQ